MITKCPYCDYSYPDEPLSLDIIKQVQLSEKITEDYLLWMGRLLKDNQKKYGFKSYNGVKVHIGRKHKGEYNSPRIELNKAEVAAINSELPK